MEAPRQSQPQEVSQRPTWDDFFMSQVDLAATMSTCATRQVGGVLVRGNRIVSQGFNGNLPGAPHCTDGGCSRCASRAEGNVASGENLEICLCVHCEQNIIAYCAANGIAMAGTTLYLPCNPCLDCFKLVVSASVSEIVFPEVYPGSLDITLTIANQLGVIMRRPNGGEW